MTQAPVLEGPEDAPGEVPDPFWMRFAGILEGEPGDSASVDAVVYGRGNSETPRSDSGRTSRAVNVPP